MIDGILTTCHTQYTSDSSIYIFYLIEQHSKLLLHTLQVLYTGCNRRNGPDFGRVFLMLNYTEKPQNAYIQS